MRKLWARLKETFRHREWWETDDAYIIDDPDEPTTPEGWRHEAEMRALPEGTVARWSELVIDELERRATTPSTEDRLAQAVAVADDITTQRAANERFLASAIRTVDELKTRPPASS